MNDNPNRARFSHRASYINDRLDLVEEEIKATRNALSTADLDPDQFEKARRLLSKLIQVIDRAHDDVHELTRLL